ncbi:hypothetical protein [Achromobacter spanius]|uniref:hypothetical protein n=1 Tax=Achromobacter spanius TaxID=217203 RepID=UPI0038267729
MTFLIDDFVLSRDLAKGRTPGKAIGNFPKCQLHCLCGFGHGAGLAQFCEVQFCAQTICLENSLSDLRAEGPYTVLAGEQSADLRACKACGRVSDIWRKNAALTAPISAFAARKFYSASGTPGR